MAKLFGRNTASEGRGSRISDLSSNCEKLTAIIPILLSAIAILVLHSCTREAEWVEPDDYVITLDPRLKKDSSGFYHLTLLRDRYQTTHRVSGSLLDSKGNPPYKEQKVSWESSHTWVFNPGDTVVKIYRRKVDMFGKWTILDSSRFVAPTTFIVPTINPSSYSAANGEINTMIGPVLSMLGDTMLVQAVWTSQWYATDTIRASVRIILE
ncbi:MAG: hypothetical protein RL156_883 [Bacteroidota bacterium]